MLITRIDQLVMGRLALPQFPSLVGCSSRTELFNRGFTESRGVAAPKRSGTPEDAGTLLFVPVPLAWLGISFHCMKASILPLYGAHVASERFHNCWPLPHVRGFPTRGVLSASPTAGQPSRGPCFARLVPRYPAVGGKPTGSPLFPRNPLDACRRYEPWKPRRTTQDSVPGCSRVEKRRHGFRWLVAPLAAPTCTD